MKNIVLILAVVGLAIIIALGTLSEKDIEPTKLMKLKEKYAKKHISSVDHSKFEVLQREFNSPQEVTATCITCHNKRHTEVMNSNHWNWEREEFIEGRGVVYLGKKNAINNFCIGTQGNEQSCAKCHIGYGMDSQGKVFTDSANVDCLVCHDKSETYVKGLELGGGPAKNLNFNVIAQSVGKPDRTNCGVCHFYGGGGNNVKHGDLDDAMFQPEKKLDIHMGIDGMNLTCVDCHTTEKHNIAGKVYSLSSMNRNRNDCEQCHTASPHSDDILNEHTIKVACQTCHIPTYAKANSTKMHWDWSTAGKLKNGEPYHEEDSLGNHTYLSIKGSFKWANNIKPDYVWFNGTASHYLEGDAIPDSTKQLVLNQLHGAYSNEDSKIVPVKIHVANQPYDPVNRMLIQPKLFAEEKGQGAFWKDFDWKSSAEVGMKEAGLPFSGQIDFLETIMYWPINHQVSSKEESVQCKECHTRDNGRLANLKDFYMPGRDYSPWVDNTAYWMIILSILGVFTHGSVRLVSFIKSKKEKNNG